MPAVDGRAAEAQLFHLDRPVRRSYYRRSICACPTHVPFPQAPSLADNAASEDDMEDEEEPAIEQEPEEDQEAFEPLPPVVQGPLFRVYQRDRIPEAWVKTVPSDGSCFFHAVSRVTGHSAADLRARVCDYGEQILTDMGYYPFVASLDDRRELTRLQHFAEMRNSKYYATELELCITANLLQRPIAIFNVQPGGSYYGPFRGFNVHWPQPAPPDAMPAPIWLAHQGLHYAAVVPDP